MNINIEDLLILARTIYGEARGEPHNGRVAVAHVILNRARHDKSSIAQVCLKPWQFSAWNPQDPNFMVIQNIDLSSKTFRACLQAGLEALSSSYDPTKNSRHYHTHSVSPSWSQGHEPVLIIGNHRFFNDIR